MPAPSQTKLAIRPAATLILLREGARGPELLMQRRASAAVFLGGAYVFPGGALEISDADPGVQARVVGLSEEQARTRLTLAEGALAYWVAAARECFEEAGILLTQDEAGSPIAPDRVAAMTADREALNRRELGFAELLARHRQFLRASELIYFDHRITPPIRPRRFDTRFFVASAPPGQGGSHDNNEAIDSAWLRPRDALDLAGRKEIEIAPVTAIVLEELARFANVDQALAHARAKEHIEADRVVVAQGRTGQQVFRRDDAAYAEIHWTDPEETMRTSYDLVPGIAKRLDRWVTRLIAPNPGMMTGPGTNTYLVGDRELAVIDPGPAIDAHVAAILALGGERIRWILCTHTHRDHSPAARALQAATGARVIGLPPPAVDSHDSSFAPEVLPTHDQELHVAGLTLRALHTPGHASNHLCFMLAETRMLFTGDHVMQGSTVIINPPDGDMRAYLDSLEALSDRDIAIIAPGHGYLIGTPHREIRKIIQHRLQREAKVIDALDRLEGATLSELVPVVYAETPQRLHSAAARSLLAHLYKLVAEERVTEAAGCYRARRL
ncbi:MAG: MBL fold metallo-hydrolase [Burkholderiales bacterium]|nr:MBL fold metallo-hydrolase [Burkholderiales bacterium]